MKFLFFWCFLLFGFLALASESGHDESFDYTTEEFLPDTVAISEDHIELNQTVIRSIASDADSEVSREGGVEFWLMD